MTRLLDKKDELIIFIFLGLVILFFSQVLFTQATYIYRDFYHTYYPTLYFVSQCIKEGQFPFWNPYLYFGFPLFGSLQHGLLNPLSFLMYILPFDFGIKLFIVGHFCLAGIFMYLLMRDWGAGRFASLVAALTYTFNGFILTMDLLFFILAACWIPLIFLFYNRAINSGKFKYIVLTSISLTFQFFGGEPTVFYATLITLGLFTLAKVVIKFEDWRIEKGKERRKKILKILLIFLLAGLITIGLVFIQLLPFLEAIDSSYRAKGIVYSQVLPFSAQPLDLLTLILPEKGGFVEFIIPWGIGSTYFKRFYFGIIAFFLIIVSLYSKSKRNLFWIGIFLGSIILIQGDSTPFYRFLYEHFPFFSMHRYPIKFFCLTIFAGSMLAGFGFEYLLKTIKNRKITPLIVLFISNLVLIFMLLIWYLNFNKFLWLFKVYNFQPVIIDELIDVEGRYVMLFKNFALVTMFFSIFNLLALLTQKLRLNLNLFSTVSIIIIITDLFFFGLNLNSLVNQKFYHQKPPTLEILKKDKESIFRFLIETKTFDYSIKDNLFDTMERFQLTLMPNFPMMHKLFGVYGYGFLPLNDYCKFINQFQSGSNFFNVQRLLNLINVKYIISKYEIPSNQVKLVYMNDQEGKEIRVYENLICLPRAFFVPKARIVKDRENILNMLSSPKFDPKEEVIIEEEIRNPKSEIQNKSQIPNKSEVQNPKSKIIDYQPNKVTINTSCPNDGFLFLSDTYYPGWQAYIDGKLTKVYRANFLFRAIVLPQGDHQVEFVYSPLSFKIGLLGTLITIIILIIVSITRCSGFKVKDKKILKATN